MDEFTALCDANQYACARQSYYLMNEAGDVVRLPYFVPNELPPIIFRPDMSNAPIGPWAPGVNKVANGVDSGCSNFYQTAIHEVGHAFGCGQATVDGSRDVSIMEPRRDRLHCSPKLYDVAAMMALCQSHDVGDVPPTNP